MTRYNQADALVNGLYHFRITEAATEARKALPASHPAQIIDKDSLAPRTARDEAIARAWFHWLIDTTLAPLAAVPGSTTTNRRGNHHE